MYQVIESFIDLQDDNHRYRVGDAFPRAGKNVPEERIKELAGSDNKLGMPLIAADKPKKKAKKAGDQT